MPRRWQLRRPRHRTIAVSIQSPMTDNTQRFAGRAENYDLYRQRYPSDQVLAQLCEWCGLTSQWLVAEIGAGTGMLTEVFLANGNPVLAIEPNSDMRDQMHKTFDGLGKCWPSLEIIDATAEATTLPDASVDLVAAGRAFHWFDTDRALAEFRRILKPTGWVALVSVGRASLDPMDQIDPTLIDQLQHYECLLTDYGTDYRYIRAGYRVHEHLAELFDGEFHQANFPGEQRLNWDAFRGQTLSLSVVPAPDDSRHETFIRQLQIFFDRFAQDGVLTQPTSCWISAGRFRIR